MTTRVGTGGSRLDPARLLSFLEEVHTALSGRDEPRLVQLMRSPLERQLPRAVREEILAIRRAPPTSTRAPLQLLMFARRVLQLRLDEIRDGDGRQLTLEFPAPSPVEQVSSIRARTRRASATKRPEPEE